MVPCAVSGVTAVDAAVEALTWVCRAGVYVLRY